MNTLGRPRRHAAVVASTMDEAAAWADAGAPHGALLTADHQTRGRGRLGRTWTDAPGESLLASLVLRDLDANRLGLVPLAAGQAVAHAVEAVANVEAQVKWPNDVLVSGRKVAGILTEARHGAAGATVLLGIGANVAQRAFPPALAARASSLAIEAGQPVSRDALLDALLDALARSLERLQAEPAEAFVARFEARMAARGARVVLTDAAGGTTAGTALGVAPDGALRLDVDGAEQHVYAGDVTTAPRVLALDVGNSTVKAGVWNGEAWTVTRWPTSAETSVEAWAARLSDLAPDVTAGGLVSVVPDVGATLDAAVHSLGVAGWRGPLHAAASSRVAPTPGLNLSTAGADRLAAAVGGAVLAGSGVSAVVVCAGTAVTVEGVRAVEGRHVWEGGAIAPGPDLLRRSLPDHTAALPLVAWPDAAPPPFGASTPEAMQSGLAGLYAGGVAGLIRRAADALDGTPLVVATGGWASWLAAHIQGIDRVEPTLILDGVRALVQNEGSDSG